MSWTVKREEGEEDHESSTSSDPKVENSFTGKTINSPRHRSEKQLKELVQSLTMHEDQKTRIVDRHAFKALMMMITMVNSLQMGLEIEFPDWTNTWLTLEIFFTAVFLLEMIFKLFSFRWHYFDDKANWLDGGLAMLGVFDNLVLALIAGDNANLRRLSTLRILRLMRLARLFRLVHRVKPLVLVIQGVTHALSVTVYVLLVCLLFIYIFAIFLTETLGKSENSSSYPGYSSDSKVIDRSELMMNYNPHVYFGSLLTSMITLFNMATFTEWPEVIRPIAIKQPWYLIIFGLFITILGFGLMNVLIGAIVDSVLMESKRVDAEYQESLKNHKVAVLDGIQSMLQEIDMDHDGLICWEELDQAMNENEVLKNLVRKLHLPRAWSSHELLGMLDHNGDGLLTHAEFTTSVFRLLDSDDFQKQCIMAKDINEIKSMVNDLKKSFGKVLSGMQKDVAAIQACLGIDKRRHAQPEGQNPPRRASAKINPLDEANEGDNLVTSPSQIALDLSRQSTVESKSLQFSKFDKQCSEECQTLISRMELVVRECIQQELFAHEPNRTPELRCSTPQLKALGSQDDTSKAANTTCLRSAMPASGPMQRPVQAWRGDSFEETEAFILDAYTLEVARERSRSAGQQEAVLAGQCHNSAEDVPHSMACWISQRSGSGL